MKNFRLLALGLLAICCQKKDNTRPIETAAPEAAAMAPVKTCYLYAKNADTISLSLSMNANNVNGLLDYKLREKDENTGTISGTFIGDTLYADYAFQSEGTTSVREVVFLRSGGKLTEGHGDMEEKGVKMVFKNPKQVGFGNPGLSLQKIDCGD
jgi:hypothetical protein